MDYAVMALKTSTDKESLEALAFEVSQITAYCINNNIKLTDCIISFSGAKDILKRVKRLDKKKRFNLLIIYSPHQVAKGPQEYNAFVETLRNDFSVSVKYLRM